jgi:hypothetical protein
MIICPEKLKMLPNFRIEVKELPLPLDSSHCMLSKVVLETNILYKLLMQKLYYNIQTFIKLQTTLYYTVRTLYILYEDIGIYNT